MTFTRPLTLIVLLVGLILAASGCFNDPEDVRFRIGEPLDDAGADGTLVDTGLVDTGLADTGLVDTGLADTGSVDDAGTEQDAAEPGNPVVVPDTGGEPNVEPPLPLVPVEPIPAIEGILITTFSTTPAAAFDGETEQSGSEAASTPLYFASPTDLWIGKDWRCPVQIRKVEVHEPSDGSFITDERNYPEGGPGTAYLLGRRAGQTTWTTIASVPFEASNPSKKIVFTTEQLDEAGGSYVTHAVSFTPEGLSPGTLQVAEIVFYGGCSGPESVIDWAISDWSCTDVTCVLAENHGGLNQRTVNCLRDGVHAANEELCPQPKPATTGTQCSLSCPYQLVYIGNRPFTYANDSGWLHEGSLTRRAGPLPSSTHSGTTVEAIAGKPCSIETTTPSTYFVGISCTSGGDYCAFRCQ
jgi:hypothetical protein